MKILFVNLNIGSTIGINNGLTILSAVCKHHGEQVELLNLLTEPFENQVIDTLNKYIPELIGISIIETQFQYVMPLITIIKNYSTAKIVVGGPYVTMNFETIKEIPEIDFVCAGESEKFIINIINRIDLGDDSRQTFFPTKFTDLNFLPSEDKELFPLKQIIEEKGDQFESSIGRGCVYVCSYCINDSYLKKYQLDKKHCIRMKPIKIAVIDDIFHYSLQFAFSKVSFIDDDFLIYDHLHPQQKRDFYDLYKQTFHGRLPFYANASPLSYTYQIGLDFKNAGGIGLRFGIESTERLRKTVLNRAISDNLLRKVFHDCADIGIETSSYNMIGLPEEQKEDLINLIKLNAELKPNFVKFMIFFPFHGTPLYDYCKELDLVDESKQHQLNNYETESCLRFAPDYLLYLKRIEYCFHWYLNYYLGFKKETEMYLIHLHTLQTETAFQYFKQNSFEKMDQKIRENLKGPHYEKISRSVAKLL